MTQLAEWSQVVASILFISILLGAFDREKRLRQFREALEAQILALVEHHQTEDQLTDAWLHEKIPLVRGRRVTATDLQIAIQSLRDRRAISAYQIDQQWQYFRTPLPTPPG